MQKTKEGGGEKERIIILYTFTTTTILLYGVVVLYFQTLRKSYHINKHGIYPNKCNTNRMWLTLAACLFKKGSAER